MKYILIFLFFSSPCFITEGFAQGGIWTWMNGDTIATPSVHGAAGVFNPSFHPDAYYERNHWIDKQGNLWYMADGDSLWKYDIGLNQWAWIKGTGSITHYGIKGISSPSNSPGSRTLCALTWTDTTGSLWLFGGYIPWVGLTPDLWKYDVQINEWTWMSGDTLANDLGNFGVMGVPSVNNYPSARAETNATWVDSSDNSLWFYAGQIPSNAASNDLWRYQVSTNEWTWMKGDTIANTLPVYGSKGISNPANSPGSRDVYSKWTDSNGNFWMFGGWDYIYSIYYNDVWRYEKSNNSWTWMHGRNVDGYNSGNCTEDSLNIPPLVFENKLCWTDRCGKFWTFYWDNLLWVFNPTTANWILPRGTHHQTIPVHYGTIGIPDPANTPFYWSGSEGWTDRNGNFWLYQAIAPAMWKFTPDLICPGCLTGVPTSNFNANDTLLCPGVCTSFNNLSVNATSYLWSFPGASPDTSTAANPSNICFNTPGNYDVQLIVYNATGSDTLTLTNFITVYPYPSPQGIQQAGDTLIANQGASGYQWYFNGNIINGATDYFYVASQSGDYNVVCTDENGCEVEAVIFDVIASAGNEIKISEIEIYPSPVQDQLEIRNLNFELSQILIYNIPGEVVLDFPSHEINESGSIDVSTLPPGMYYIELISLKRSFRTKFIKE